MRLVIAIFLLAAWAVRPQQVGQNAPPGSNGTATFTTATQLVVETVVATDKKGSPIESLTDKDFTVTENGVTQAIRFFEHQNLPQTRGAVPVVGSEPEHIHIYDKLGRTQIS